MGESGAYCLTATPRNPVPMSMNRTLPAVCLMAALTPALSAQRILESEPNDTAATGQLLTFGVHVDANLVAGTQDWYQFNVTSPSEVHVQTCGNFAVNSTVDTVVLLYDAAGVTRLAWNDQQRGSHSDMGVTLPVGSYAALVVGKLATTAGDYGLDLIAYPATVASYVEGAEPNGDPALGETPTPITLGGTITGSLSSPTDEDWYSFTVTGRTVVQAIVLDDGGVPQLDNCNLSLRQEIAPGSWIAFGTASTSTSHRALTLAHTATLPPGNYALRIAAGAVATGTPPFDYVKTGAYGIRTAIIDMPGTLTVVEASEPNNTPLTAAFMGLGDMATGNISGGNEGDWYGIAVGGPTTICAMSANGSPSAITDTTIRLWDATGTVTLATATTGGASSHARLIFTVNMAGLYYLEVAGGLVASAGDYVLYTGATSPLFVSATFNQQPPSTNACPGSNALRPALNRANGEVPQLGSAFVMRVNNALPNAVLLTGLGFSNTTAFNGTVPLPLDLTFLGGPGCVLRADPELQGLGVADGSGLYFWDLQVPLASPFLGLTAYAQVLLVDVANNPGGFSVTNEVKLVVGNRGF